jgi:hypothetical protein
MKVVEGPLDLARAHLAMARRNMFLGNHSAAEHDLGTSKIHAERHFRKLAGQGFHQEAEAQRKAHDGLVRHIQSLKGVVKTESAPTMTKIAPSSTGESPARREMMSTGHLSDKAKVQAPGQDPRYAYKPIHELSHEDQIQAHHQYQSRDMARHSYPVDPKGNLVVGRRAPIASGDIPSPKASSYQRPKSEHREGSSVRVHAPGSPYHGKLGVVRLPHPGLPDKVPVQVGHRAHEIVYVSHDQVKPSRPSTKMEKAMINYLNIRKMLVRVE